MKKRDYKQNCSLALASDYLCERWTFLIFRELLIQPCRFKQLNTWLMGMGTNLLTQRLKDLESENLIEKTQPAEKRSPYCLSEKGKTVEPIILSLIRWGHFNLSGDSEYQHFDHWDLLAMKALFIAKTSKKKITVQFEAETLTAWVTVCPKELCFALGKSSDYDVLIPSTIAQFYSSMEKRKDISDPLMREFLTCFKTNS